MVRRVALSGMVLALATGCTSSGTDTSSGGEATDGASASEVAAETSAPEEPEMTIRDFDFGTVAWRDTRSQTQARFGTGEAGQTTQLGDIAYADVDDDGDEDALAGLEVIDGNGYQQTFYIWTWDAEQQTAVQVEEPIAHEMRCGDTVAKVAGGDGEFTVTERLLYPGIPLPDCAADPPIAVERSIRLVDGWPVLTTGQGGHGGICPQPPGTDAVFGLDGVPVYAGPLEATGTLDPAVVRNFAEVDLTGHRWLFRRNWMLIHFFPETKGPDDGFGQYGDYVPCGWVYLEDDTRSAPR